jgi:hypothetical protein
MNGKENYAEKRRYLRHALDIPIQIQMEEVATDEKEYLIDIGAGGLSFKSRVFIENGKKIHIKIPLIKPIFEAEGEVVWSKKKDEYYYVGVKFVQDVDIFRMRMVEQVCYIQRYKEEIREKEGRILTGTQAAMEWIQKFASNFPHEKTSKKK